MALVRKLAQSISRRVVRWASPGCKEWAEAQAREIEFIRSDWAALGWAIGSMRVVLHRSVIPAGSQKGASKRAPRWWMWPYWLAFMIPINVLDACGASNWHDRIAYSLIAFGWTYCATLSVADWLWKRNEPPIADLQAYRLFTRATLERRLERYRSVRRWFPLSIPISMCIGFVMTEGGSGWGHMRHTAEFVMAGTIAVWLMCLETPAKIQSRIERMDGRIATAPQIFNLELNVKRLHSDHWGGA
jgi:hypothetical protein